MNIKVYIINSSLKSHEEFGESIFAKCSEFTHLYRFFPINKLDGSKIKKMIHIIQYTLHKRKKSGQMSSKSMIKHNNNFPLILSNHLILNVLES